MLTEANALRSLLSAEAGLRFAILVGSRARGSQRRDSDWDIAVAWRPSPEAMTYLSRHEALRQRLSRHLSVPDTTIDLIDLASAGLAMRALVANEGLPLCIMDELAWTRFQTTAWRDLEDFHWEKTHAA